MSYPMEKYLDPNRPFKCEVCKESFTQKNILLVHYNSVSHLHKLKLSMKENNAPNSVVPITTVSNSNVSSPASPTVVLNSVNTTPSSNKTSTKSVVSNSAELDKNPYKCNLCKVSYSNSPALDHHLRSVIHQSKSAKIKELVIAGDLDLTTPLVERPETETSAESTIPKRNTEIVNTPSENVAINLTTSSTVTPKPSDPIISQVPATTVAPTIATPQFPFPLHPDHNSIMQQALNLASMQSSMLPGPAPPFQCSRCGTMCSSQDALIQHQQMYCLFAQAPIPPLLNSASATNQQPVLPNLSQLSQRQQTTDEPPDKQPKLNLSVTESTSSNSVQMNIANNQRCPTPGQQMFKNRFPFLRPKPLIFRHLLESFGFDVVMQFNENSQKRKKETEKKEEEKENAIQTVDTEEKGPLKKKMDLLVGIQLFLLSNQTISASS